MVDPGEHQVTGKRANEVVQESVQLAERDKKQVVLRFSALLDGAPTGVSASSGAPPATPPVPATSSGTAPSQPHQAPRASDRAFAPVDSGNWSSNAQRTVGWVGVGLGAAGLALGTVTGIYVATKHADLDSKCPDRNICDPRYESEVSTYHTMQTLSTVGFVVGSISTAAGITLLLTTPKQESSNVALWVAPHMAGVRGNF